MPLASSSPIFVNKIIKRIGNVQFISFCYAIYVERCGEWAFITFFERVSLMVFHAFLISDLYLSNVDAKNCCLAADMLRLRILLNVSYVNSWE